MKKARFRTILLSLLCGMCFMHPLSVPAQVDRGHGHFGEGAEVNSNCLLNRGSISTDNITNQPFGETQVGITNETFGNTTPLGEGLVVMLLGGAGYMMLKKRKNNESNQ